MAEAKDSTTRQALDSFILERGQKPGRTTGPRFSTNWRQGEEDADDRRRKKWEEDRSLWNKAWDAALRGEP